MNRDDIVKSWGAYNLKCWPEQCLRDVAIPEPSRSFLVNVGLPAFKDVGFQFDPLVGGPPRLAGRPWFRSISLMYEGHLVCLNEEADGSVVSIDPELQDLGRYINSSVERFAECLVLYLQFRGTGQVATEAEFRELGAQFERDLLKADATVFSNPENFCAVLVWELKQGFE
jgi:hypothetical protein